MAMASSSRIEAFRRKRRRAIGSETTTRWRVAAFDSPGHQALARWVKSSHKTTPIAKMSERRSVGPPRACSGAMYDRILLLEDTHLRVGRVRPRLRDAEVDELHLAVVGDEDVVRAHVAVNDAERAASVVTKFVSAVQSRGSIGDDARRDERVERLSDARRFTEHFVKRLTVQVFHRDEVRAAEVADLVGLDDVRVIEARGEPRFVEEHPPKGSVLGKRGPEPLDDHELVEACWTARDGEEHV